MIVMGIIYNNWMPKASIAINDKTTYWKHENIRRIIWSISDSNGLIINSTVFYTSGTIVSSTDDLWILLNCLYVTNY